MSPPSPTALRPAINGPSATWCEAFILLQPAKVPHDFPSDQQPGHRRDKGDAAGRCPSGAGVLLSGAGGQDQQTVSFFTWRALSSLRMTLHSGQTLVL